MDNIHVMYAFQYKIVNNDKSMIERIVRLEYTMSRKCAEESCCEKIKHTDEDW